MKQCSRKTVLSIKVSLSLNHLKTRGIGGFKGAFHASAIRVDLRLAAETELYREASDDPKYKVILKPETKVVNLNVHQSRSVQREAGEY